MGREIRRVPANWEHPKKSDGRYQPCFDKDFDTKLTEWLAEYELFKAGEHECQEDGPVDIYDFADWVGSPPNIESYRPKFESEPTWYQVYETVSEGTPVTPPFATKAEIVDYLVAHGDFWDQQRGDGGWSRAAAEGFCEREWAMSMVMVPGKGIFSPRDGMPD